MELSLSWDYLFHIQGVIRYDFFFILNFIYGVADAFHTDTKIVTSQVTTLMIWSFYWSVHRRVQDWCSLRYIFLSIDFSDWDYCFYHPSIYIDIVDFWMKLQGGWEIDETLKDAALRETFEEAGVLGDVEVQVNRWNLNFYTIIHIVDPN